MAANWAGAYGAGGATDALREIVADKLLREKIAEDNRRAQVQEANEAKRIAMADEHARMERAARQGEFVSQRDERHTDRLEDVRRLDLGTQERATERDITRKTRIDEAAERRAQREADIAAHVADREDAQAFQARLQAGSQAFQREQNAGTRTLADEMKQIQIDAARDKLETTRRDAAKQADDAKLTTQSAYDSVRSLLNPKGAGAGLDAATGAYEMRGWTQGAEDFKAERDRLIAMLTQPHLGALKGPMSDKDVIFVKSLATKLQSGKMSDTATRAELGRLQGLLEDRMGVPRTAGASVQRKIRNPATGQEMIQTSTDGVNWQ